MGAKSRMGPRKWVRWKRQKMFEHQRGKCWWFINGTASDGCIERKGVMVMDRTNGGAHPKNLCTIDHLRDRYDPERQIPATGDQRLVAACSECNGKRNREREASLPRDVLWVRSGAYPMSVPALVSSTHEERSPSGEGGTKTLPSPTSVYSAGSGAG